jgi:hypothetical protein
VPTVALVVLHLGESLVPPCRVRFSAAFPTRAVKPVTVRDEHGAVVPSRIVHETATRSPDLPEGKFLWSLVLEFAIRDGLPPYSGRAFGASYEPSVADESEFSRLPLHTDLPVYETSCHTGDIPTAFLLSDFDKAFKIQNA